MSSSEIDSFQYYEETDANAYNNTWFWEKQRFSKEKYPNTYVPRQHTFNPNDPTINYFNERQCPIYSHKLQQDSSVSNNYNYEIRKTPQRPLMDGASKQVLDKLEESYWAMWKPKKPNSLLRTNKVTKRVPIAENYELKEHSKTVPSSVHKHKNQPDGDVNDLFVKYFKTSQPRDSFTIVSNSEEEKPKRVDTPKRIHKKCKSKPKKEKDKTVVSKDMQTSNDEFNKILSSNDDEAIKTMKNNTSQITAEKVPKEDNDKDKINVRGTRSTCSLKADDADVKFIEHKDSILITKEKIEKQEKKEHFQQPRSIRLFKKAGASTSFVKGGSYPLKTCLKREPARESLPKANFRLGAPGSSLLFVTTKRAN